MPRSFFIEALVTFAFGIFSLGGLVGLSLGLACGGDDEAMMEQPPADGSVAMWDSCQWLGFNMAELCEPGLLCGAAGVCMPSCQTAAECPMIDGYETICDGQSATGQELVCIVLCDENRQCPLTSGEKLTCSFDLHWCT